MAVRSEYRSAASSSLGSQVQILLRAWMLISCAFVRCVGSGVDDQPITRSEESSGCVCLTAYNLETSTMRRPFPISSVAAKKKYVYLHTRLFSNGSYIKDEFVIITVLHVSW